MSGEVVSTLLSHPSIVTRPGFVYRIEVEVGCERTQVGQIVYSIVPGGAFANVSRSEHYTGTGDIHNMRLSHEIVGDGSTITPAITWSAAGAVSVQAQCRAATIAGHHASIRVFEEYTS